MSDLWIETAIANNNERKALTMNNEKEEIAELAHD
ncbi:unnamed protein product, partial [marine sediment metagenome]